MIGNGLGKFVCASKDTVNYASSTCVHICGEVDLSDGLPAKIVLMVGKRKWQQLVDYERIAFRCGHCFSTENSTQLCPKTKTFEKGNHTFRDTPMWWIGAESHHYVVPP